MVDIILVLVVLVVAMLGSRKGLISVVMKLVGLILAVILASYFYKGLALYMYNNFSFGKNIENTIVTTIRSKVIENVVGEEEDKDKTEEVPDVEDQEDLDKEAVSEEVKINMDFSKVIETVKSWGIYNKVQIDENVVVDNEQAGKTLVGGIAYKITMYIMRAIAFVSIFVCIIIVTAIVSLILTLLFMLPGLKAINKTGGFIAETILFLVKLSIILAIISFIQPIGFVSNMIEYINTKTIIVKWLYNHNLVFTILNRYL